MNKPFLLTVVVSGTISAQGLAQDQPWLQDREDTVGAGWRVGDVEIHPGVAAEAGYDSNYFHRSDNDALTPVDAARFRVTPSLAIQTLGKQRGSEKKESGVLDFRISASGSYNEFIPISGSDLEKEKVTDQRNILGDASGSFTFFPGRVFSVALFGGIGRSVAPTNEADVSASFNRILPRGGAELIFAPGGGLLDWRLGYGIAATIFEADAFGNLDNLQHTGTLRGRWRFYPRTALVYDGSVGFQDYVDGSGKGNSMPVRTRLGVNGLVTPSFGVLAMVGWGASFYESTPTNPAQDFDSVIGQAEVKWYLDPSDGSSTSSGSALTLGFTRDFADSYIGTHFVRNRGYMQFSYLFGGSFLLMADAGIAALQFPGNPSLTDFRQDPTGTSALEAYTDLGLDGTLYGEYRIKSSIGIGATLRYGANLSDVRLSSIGARPEDGDELDWHQFEAFLGVRWFL